LLPVLSAVSGLEHATIAARPPQISDRRDVNRIGACGMRDDARNLERVAQPDVGERFATVGRLVDAVAPRNTVAVVRLTCADPKYAWIRLVDLDVADRRRSVMVEDRRPRRSCVGALPDSAGGCGRDHETEIGIQRLDVGDAPAWRAGPDAAPLIVSEHRTDLVGRRRLSACSKR